MQNQKCDQNKRDFFLFVQACWKSEEIKSNQILYVISMMLGSTFSGFKNRGCLLDCGVGFSGSRGFLFWYTNRSSSRCTKKQIVHAGLWGLSLGGGSGGRGRSGFAGLLGILRFFLFVAVLAAGVCKKVNFKIFSYSTTFISLINVGLQKSWEKSLSIIIALYDNGFTI